MGGKRVACLQKRAETKQGRDRPLGGDSWGGGKSEKIGYSCGGGWGEAGGEE